MSDIPNTIFIVPYKNRPTQKIEFIKYFNKIIEKNSNLNKNSTKLFFINQNDNRIFNRGGIKNIGFLIVKKLYPNNYKNITLIYHDIDTFPKYVNLLDYDTANNTIKHYYGYKFALGGIFAIKAGDFELTTGFPNFWGWGYEDNVMVKRANNKNIKIDHTIFYNPLDENIIRLNDENSNNISNYKLISKREISMYLHNENLDSLNDIKNLNYTEEKLNDLNNIIQYNINNFTTKRIYNSTELYKINMKTEKKDLPNIIRGWFRRDWNMFRNL